jgi:hypothetical protein
VFAKTTMLEPARGKAELQQFAGFGPVEAEAQRLGRELVEQHRADRGAGEHADGEAHRAHAGDRAADRASELTQLVT